MTIYTLGSRVPRIASSAYIAPGAVVIGDVVLEGESSVWFGAVLRGDNEQVRVGRRSNIQDGSVLHTDIGFPLVLGDDVSVGHQAMLHGCTVHDGALIGIQAVILNAAVIGRNCLVGAGAVVTERKVFPEGSLILGAPAKVVRELRDEERAALLHNAEHYASRLSAYRDGLRALAGDGAVPA